MPAKTGQPKADAGKVQKQKTVETAPQKDSERPTLDEVTPLFDTYNQPKPEGSYFDEDAAKAAVEWIENHLRHFQGKWAGEKFYLLAWQVRLIRELFGWMREDGLRLYRRCYVEAPRKSGKSSLASAIGLYLTYADNEPGCQTIFAAHDKDQARICYDAARLMVEASPELHKKTKIYLSRKEMIQPKNPGSVIKCASSDSSKSYGLNIHALIFDEIMTQRGQRGRDLWSALTTAMGARDQPMLFAISTAGWDRQSICFEQHSHTESIASGTTTDPSFLGVIYGADMEADWNDPEVWKQSNPSLGHTVQESYYAEAAHKAMAIPAEQNAFRTLFLSQWVGQEMRLIPMDKWEQCSEPMATPEKRIAFGGLDLAATTDFTAFVVVAEEDGVIDVFPHLFLPSENLRERERRDKAPYSVWADQGLLTLTPGSTTDYEYVKDAIMESAEVFDLRDVSYDRWNASQIVQELEGEGIQMVQLGQGFASMSSPTKSLLKLVMEGKVRHGGHPVLKWMASNVAGRTDPAGNLKPDKEKSAQKIDGIVALIMALDGQQRRGRKSKRKSFYSDYSLSGQPVAVGV